MTRPPSRSPAPASRTVDPAAARQLQLIGALASLVNQTFDLDELFRAIILRLRDVLEFRRASVALLTEDERSYYLHTLFDAAAGGFLEAGGSFPLDSGVTGKVIRTGEPILLDDFSGTAGIRLSGENNVSVMIVPLRVDQEVIGALNFGAPASRTYGQEHLELAVLLGYQIETSLHYSRLLATIRDQASQLEAKHAQASSERSRLSALVDASDAAVLMISGDRVVHANHVFGTLVGRPREVVQYWSLAQVHEALARRLAHAETLEPQARALAEGNELRDRVEFTVPNRLVCQRLVTPVHDAGSLLGHVIIYRDVTKEAEAAAAKDEFVSIVSHELRTPLTSIKTSIDLLARGAVGADQAGELVAVARRNLGRLIRLVDDLLDLSKIEAGRLTMRRRPVPLQKTATHALGAVEAFATSRDVRLKLETEGEAPVVLGDADRLEQVVINLVANGVKFSPPGSEVRVVLVTAEGGGRARLEVIDQGQGIPPDRLETIFDKFYQVESADTRSHGGAGLGLAISRGIVELLGGRIWAENAPSPQGGARFVVELPIPAAQIARPLPASRTVLLVDGDVVHRATLAGVFQDAGWIVEETGEGTDVLGRTPAPSPLLVIGQRLGDMHGLELLHRLRESPVWVDVPVIMVGTEDLTKARTYGADGCVAHDSAALLDEAARVVTAARPDVILLIEDDPELRSALRRALHVAGYRCLAAGAGADGLALARARHPRVIVTDLLLPGSNGLEVLQQLQQDPELASVPSIVVTAYADAGIRERIRALGARMLDKPFEPSDLLHEIGKLIGGA